MKNATLELDLNALYINARNILNNTDGGVIATVKNDAYHFGLKKAVDTFYKAGIRAFATTSIRECIQIRSWYDDVTIISLNPTIEFKTLREYNISCALSTLDFTKKHYKEMHGIKWHLEWAGKMRRSGCRSKKEFFEVLDFCKSHNIIVEGIWTHFSWADEFDENKTYEEERSVWIDVQKEACSSFDFKFVHAQNSASYLRDGKFIDHTHVRVGILLYGCPPYDVSLDYLRHAVRLSATVISVNKLDPGDSIGYSSAFTAKDPTLVAVVNIGYGDGVLRKRILGNSVEINGKRYQAVSIMMSHSVVVVDSDVKPSDEVFVYSNSIPVYEFTFKGVGANSEQISHLNHNTLTLKYKELDI